MSGEQLLKRVLLLGGLRKDDIEAARSQGARRLAGIELRSRELVDAARQRDEIGVRDGGAGGGEGEGRGGQHHQAARICETCGHLLAPVYLRNPKALQSQAPRQSRGL